MPQGKATAHYLNFKTPAQQTLTRIKNGLYAGRLPENP